VNPQFLPQLQESISRISLSEAREYAGALLSGSSLKRIQEIMADRKWKERFGL